MYENFKCSGEWWLPQKPDDVLSGFLIFDKQKGFLLSLIGEFKEDFSSDASKQPSIILGNTQEHGEVTLFHCILNNAPSTGRKISGGMWLEFTVSNFNPQYVFLGFCFQTKEEILFKKMYFTYSNFDEWVDISGFTLPKLPTSHDEPFIVSYKKPDDIKIKLSDNCSLSIHFTFHYPSWNSVQKDVNCKQETSLLIEFDEMTPFEKFREISHIFKNFLSFAIKNPVFIQEVEGLTHNKYQEQNAEEVIEKITVQIMAKSYNKSKLSDEILPPLMLFSYEDIAPKFELILSNWFKKNEKFEPVFNLYFSTIHNRELSFENRFLNLMHAIEAYHRRAFENFAEVPDIHQKRIDEIISAVSVENKEWLSQKLRYSNEKALVTRFNEIFEKNAKIINPFFKDEKESKKFIRTAINTRNDFTHWDPTRKPVGFDKLFYLVIKLKLILSICILTELGLDDDKVEQFSNKLVSKTRFETLIEFD